MLFKGIVFLQSLQWILFWSYHDAFGRYWVSQMASVRKRDTSARILHYHYRQRHRPVPNTVGMGPGTRADRCTLENSYQYRGRDNTRGVSYRAIGWVHSLGRKIISVKGRIGPWRPCTGVPGERHSDCQKATPGCTVLAEIGPIRSGDT